MDGSLAGTATSSPYSFPWNTTALSGSHALVSKAYDVAGNTATSPQDTVTVATTVVVADTTPPTVQISSVAYDGRFLTMTVSASDTQSGVVKVEMYIDGVLKATDTSSPWPQLAAGLQAH